MERVAQCHCGALRVTAAGEPEWVNLCHCKACQRRTGTMIHSGAYFAKARVRIEGARKVYARLADSGYDIRFHFCPECGSNVYWYASRSQITAASPSGPSPTLAFRCRPF